MQLRTMLSILLIIMIFKSFGSQVKASFGSLPEPCSNGQANRTESFCATRLQDTFRNMANRQALLMDFIVYIFIMNNKMCLFNYVFLLVFLTYLCLSH